MERGKAYRRFQDRKRKTQVKQMIGNWDGFGNSLQQDPKFVGILAGMRGFCSCAMCSYPKYDRNKNKKRFKEELKEIKYD